MIIENLREVGEKILVKKGIRVVISVPKGKELGPKTDNPRLGIKNGISILGTSGIVIPFSTASYAASIRQNLDVTIAMGNDTVVLTTGGRSEDFAKKIVDLPEHCFVQMGDFSGYTIQQCGKKNIKKAYVVGFIGKLAKMAAGVKQTHVKGSKVDMNFLAELARKSNATETIIESIKKANTLIHLVGIGKQSIKTDYDMINVEFTNHIVNLCKKAKIKNFIYTSGLGVSSNTSLGYFISKYKAERLIINSGLNYTIFRPSYIVGKDDQFTKYLKKQIKKGKIEIPGSGHYSIQPIYINDVVKIILQSVLQTKFRNKIIDLVGPDCITFEQYVKLFSNGTKTSIRKINLEDSYHSAITNSNSDFGVDDLNILIGNFKGNHDKLRKITEMKFQSVVELLKSGRLL